MPSRRIGNIVERFSVESSNMPPTPLDKPDLEVGLLLSNLRVCKILYDLCAHLMYVGYLEHRNFCDLSALIPLTHRYQASGEAEVMVSPSLTSQNGVKSNGFGETANGQSNSQPTANVLQHMLSYDKEAVIDQELAHEREHMLWFAKFTVRRPCMVMVSPGS